MGFSIWQAKNGCIILAGVRQFEPGGEVVYQCVIHSGWFKNVILERLGTFGTFGEAARDLLIHFNKKGWRRK